MNRSIPGQSPKNNRGLGVSADQRPGPDFVLLFCLFSKRSRQALGRVRVDRLIDKLRVVVLANSGVEKHTDKLKIQSLQPPLVSYQRCCNPTPQDAQPILNRLRIRRQKSRKPELREFALHLRFPKKAQAAAPPQLDSPPDTHPKPYAQHLAAEHDDAGSVVNQS